MRQSVINLDKLESLQDDPDYLATNIYLPLHDFIHSLDEYEKVICKYMLRDAQKIGFIENHHVFAIKFNVDTSAEIQRSHQKVSQVLENVARDLQNLDSRVKALEQWSSQVAEEFHKVCDNDEQMVQDIAKLGNSLNNLREVLKKTRTERHMLRLQALSLHSYLSWLARFR